MRIVTHIGDPSLIGNTRRGPDSRPRGQRRESQEEIQKLFSDLNDAITKRDRPRLEQLYADEFQFIPPSGGVINKVLRSVES